METFYPNFFCLVAEVPRRDFDGDGGNLTCWFRICNFFCPGTYPSKPPHGDMIYGEKTDRREKQLKKEEEYAEVIYICILEVNHINN